MEKFTLDELKGADRLSPDFKQAFEEFIPRWIESLIPHCDEARRQGADYLRLCNYKPTGASCTLYEKDGIGYYLSEHRGIKELAFNSDHRYIRCNWCECFNEMYPDVDNVHDFGAYNHYLTHLFHKDPDVKEWEDRINECFQNITGYADAELSIGSESMVFFNDKARRYTEEHHPYR